MKAYINHFFLNIGASLSCIYYAVIPPQFTNHSPLDLKSLSESNPIDSFIIGLFGK